MYFVRKFKKSLSKLSLSPIKNPIIREYFF